MLAFAGCQNLECGDNTIERDGKCIAETQPPGAQCGPGTYYDQSTGLCIDTLVGDGGGICGPNTTIVVNDAGVPVCVGTGSGTDCSQPIACPPPTNANTEMTVCGRIYDIEDSTPLDDGNANNGEPYKDVILRVYDPLAFATLPDPTVIATGSPDSCGRYALPDIPIGMLQSGFVSVATDDAGGTDNLVQTGIADFATAGATLTDRRAWIFRRSTDMMWSNQAGLTGDTFGTRGVYMPIFLAGASLAPFSSGTPTAGVKVAEVDSTRVVKPDQDYYFSDSDPLRRLTVSQAADMTGENGTALFINAPLLTYSGVGAEPSGTCWAKNLGASPANAAFVQERTAAAGNCP